MISNDQDLDTKTPLKPTLGWEEWRQSRCALYEQTLLITKGKTLQRSDA